MGGFALHVELAEDLALNGIDEEETVGVLDRHDEVASLGVHGHSMGAAVFAEVDDPGFLAGGGVKDGNGVAAFAGVLHPQNAVVGDVEGLAIEGADDFVGVDADFDFASAFASGLVETNFAGHLLHYGEIGLGMEGGGEEKKRETHGEGMISHGADADNGEMTRRELVCSLAPALAWAEEWTSLFDGASLAGWKPAPFPGQGKVAVREGMIVLERGDRMTGIVLTRPFPKVNYELRFEAARLEGNDFFAGLVFPVRDAFCSWICGGWDGSTVGLSNVDGYDASENETSINRDFRQGRWYGFRLAVTAERLQAWIDDSAVIDLDVTRHQLALRFDDTDLAKPLGFASYGTVGGIRKIEWRRIG